MQKRIIKTHDQQKLQVYSWTVEHPIGVIQLVHGSCEHLLRYQQLITYFNQLNWNVIGIDLRGHGQTVQLNNQSLGFFTSTNGWNVLVEDLKIVNEYINKTFSGLPVVMMGHSMGSFLTRTYQIKYPNDLDGVIICGTGWENPLALRFGRWLAQKHQNKHGDSFRDDFIYDISYRAFNKKWKSPEALGNEWLTSDLEKRLAFNNDPWCGFVFTSAAFKDMFTGMLFNQTRKHLKQISPNIPIMLISGSDDPVGKFGKGVTKTYQHLKKYNPNCTMHLIKHARHEVLFDLTNEQLQLFDQWLTQIKTIDNL